MDVYRTALLCLNSLVFSMSCEHSGLCHSMALADYIVKDFGHLNSVFSFPTGHWMLGILNIGRRKLEMTTSNSFGKGRTLLTMKV